MFIFKILLIILIALPVIAFAAYCYSKMLSYIRVRNAIENEAIRQNVAETKARRNSREGTTGSKKSKKRRKKEKQSEQEEQQ